MNLEALKNIPPSSLQAFLLKHGWDAIEHKNQRITLYQYTRKKNAKLLIPKPDSADFELRMDEALNKMGHVMSMAPDSVLSLILHPMQDVMKLRVKTEKQDSLPFDMAANIINNLRDLIYHGASNQHFVRAYLGSGSPVANRFLKRQCRFGQTFEGSFGFTAQVDMESDDSAAGVTEQEDVEEEDEELELLSTPDSELEDDTPFSRHVVERIYRGLIHSKEAEFYKSTEPLTSNYQSAFNSNMCSAVSKMFGVIDNKELEFAVEWSPNVEIQGRRFQEPIVINNTTARFLENAATELKRQIKFSEYVTVRGDVTELRIENEELTPDQVSRERRIILQGMDDKKFLKKIGKVRVYLSSEDYLNACNAHRDRRTIEIKGQLEKEGGNFYLKSPHDLRIVE